MAAALTMSPLEETSAVMSEMQQVFEAAASGGDVQQIMQVAQLTEDIRATAAGAEQQYKVIIKDLQQAVAQANQVIRDTVENPMKDQHTALQSKREEAQAAIETLQAKLQAEARKLGALQRVEEDLDLRKQEEQQETEAAVPVVKSLLQLYSSVTRIQWNYDVREDMEGFMHLPQQREVRAFRIRKSEGVSHLRAADMLWDMMWDETAPTASVN